MQPGSPRLKARLRAICCESPRTEIPQSSVTTVTEQPFEMRDTPLVNMVRGRARKPSQSRETRGSSGKGKPLPASLIQGSPVAARYRPPAAATGSHIYLVQCKRLRGEAFLRGCIFVRKFELKSIGLNCSLTAMKIRSRTKIEPRAAQRKLILLMNERLECSAVWLSKCIVPGRSRSSRDRSEEPHASQSPFRYPDRRGSASPRCSLNPATRSIRRPLRKPLP